MATQSNGETSLNVSDDGQTQASEATSPSPPPPTANPDAATAEATSSSPSEPPQIRTAATTAEETSFNKETDVSNRFNGSDEGISQQGVSREGEGGGAASASRNNFAAELTNRLRLQMGACRLSKKTAGGEHRFWDSQPVPKMQDKALPPDAPPSEIGALDANEDVSNVRQDPLNLPSAFTWAPVDIDDEHEIQEIYTLLWENYVEDDDAMFRFDYSKEFLRWALTSPGYRKDWHVGVRVNDEKRKLVGFITGIPVTIVAWGKTLKIAEINFLCVHKKLRSKRLTPVLVKEITRRVNLTGRWQAVYTAGVTLPRPVATCQYWHRPLNPLKLYEVRFSYMSPNMTESRAVKLYKLPEKPTLDGMRTSRRKDIPAISKIISTYLSRFKLFPQFDEAEIAHWFLPKDKVLYSYVREVAGEVTDLVSFYSLPSTVIGNKKIPTLKVAYSFYMIPGKSSLKDLMTAALTLAYNEGFDVFNTLDVMNQGPLLKELKYGRGDGNLHYYLYNFKGPDIEAGDVGLVLL